jgi:HEAT repeat protein
MRFWMEERVVSNKELNEHFDRMSALEGQGNIAGMVAELRSPIRSRVTSVRAEAAWRLGQLRAARAALPLTELLDDPDPQVRNRAARALGYIGRRDIAVVEALLRVLETETDRLVQICAIASLGELADARVVDRIVPYLVAPDWGRRASAMYALFLIEDITGRAAAEAQFEREKWYARGPKRRLLKDVDAFRARAAQAITSGTETQSAE